MGELCDNLLLGALDYWPRGSRLALAGRSLAGAQALRYINFYIISGSGRSCVYNKLAMGRYFELSGR
jgi:hypothetical protein